MFVRSIKVAAAMLALAGSTVGAQNVLSTRAGGSPHETVEWNIEGAKITVSYGRPSLKGRQLETLAPPGKIWRTGADEATVLTTDKALVLGGLRVPAGAYTLYTVPGATGWKLVVNKRTGQWGSDYDESQDLGRANLQIETLAAPVEQLTISLAEAGRPRLSIDWGSTRATVPFKVN